MAASSGLREYMEYVKETGIIKYYRGRFQNFRDYSRKTVLKGVAAQNSAIAAITCIVADTSINKTQIQIQII